MATSVDLRTLFQLGSSWVQAAAAIHRMAGSGDLPAAESHWVFGLAADSCRQVRAAVLAEPASRPVRALAAAMGSDLASHRFADILEHMACTLTALRDSPVEASVLPRVGLARFADLLAETGEAILREIARGRPHLAAS